MRLDRTFSRGPVWSISAVALVGCFGSTQTDLAMGGRAGAGEIAGGAGAIGSGGTGSAHQSAGGSGGEISTGGIGTGTGGIGTGGVPAKPPACLNGETIGGACRTERASCYRTCGEKSRGWQPLTCTGGVYVEGG